MIPASDCLSFRGRLERALLGPPLPAELSALSWHQHLLGCSPCRELLEREEALELLLASLPEPRLAPELCVRVVKRLRDARADRLDLLLDLGMPAQVPTGLAGRVLAGVRAEEELDRLLDLYSVLPPAGMAERVLAGLRPPQVRRGRLLRMRSWLALAAAAGLVALALALREDRRPPLADPRLAQDSLAEEEAEWIAFLERRPEVFELLGNPLVWASDSEPELVLGASLGFSDRTVIELELSPYQER